MGGQNGDDRSPARLSSVFEYARVLCRRREQVHELAQGGAKP